MSRRFLTFDCYGTLTDRRTGIEAARVNRYAEPLPVEASPSLIAESLATLSKALV